MQVRSFLTSFCLNSCVHNRLLYFVNSNWYTTSLCLTCKDRFIRHSFKFNWLKLWSAASTNRAIIWLQYADFPAGNIHVTFVISLLVFLVPTSTDLTSFHIETLHFHSIKKDWSPLFAKILPGFRYLAYPLNC